MEDWIKAVTAALVALTGLVAAVYKLWQKVHDHDDELDSSWANNVVRGKIEGQNKGLIVETYSPAPTEGWDMPIAVRERAAKLYAPVESILKQLRKDNPTASEARMARLIERRLGGWISHNICRELGVGNHACIVMAASLADGILPVPESKND